MNTFYFLDGLEIKEIKTVKNFDFIKTKVNKKAVEKKTDIVIPEGYVSNGTMIEKTAENIKQDVINVCLQELSAMDSGIIRVYEDMIDVLITKNVFKKEDLPIDAQAKINAKKAKRAELEALLKG